MKNMKNSSKSKVLLSVVTVAQGFGLPAMAGSVSTHTVKAASGSHFTLLEGALLQSETGLGLGLSYDYSNDPLVVMNRARTQEVAKVITDLHTLDLTLKYGIGKRTVVGLGLPIHHSTPATPAAGATGVALQNEKMSLGDSRVFGKIRLNDLENKTQAIALQLDSTLPTGNTQYYLSDDSVAIGGRFLYEVDLSLVRLAANAGYLYSSNAEITSSQMDYTHQFPLGVAAEVPITSKWAINSEIVSKLTVSASQTPGEFYLGGRYRASEQIAVYLGGGMGTLLGEGSMDYRISAGVRARLGNDAKEQVDVIQSVAAAPVKKAEEPVAVLKETKIEIGKEIGFALNSDRLTDESKQVLNEVAAVIKQNAAELKKVQISGHTDRLGSDRYNLELSRRRASSVRTYLISQGVNSSLVESEGFGETRTKYSVDPKNRRVEFNVVR